MADVILVRSGITAWEIRRAADNRKLFGPDGSPSRIGHWCKEHGHTIVDRRTTWQREQPEPSARPSGGTKGAQVLELALAAGRIDAQELAARVGCSVSRVREVVRVSDQLAWNKRTKEVVHTDA